MYVSMARRRHFFVERSEYNTCGSYTTGILFFTTFSKLSLIFFLKTKNHIPDHSRNHTVFWTRLSHKEPCTEPFYKTHNNLKTQSCHLAHCFHSVSAVNQTSVLQCSPYFALFELQKLGCLCITAGSLPGQQSYPLIMHNHLFLRKCF